MPPPRSGVGGAAHFFFIAASFCRRNERSMGDSFMGDELRCERFRLDGDGDAPAFSADESA